MSVYFTTFVLYRIACLNTQTSNYLAFWGFTDSIDDRIREPECIFLELLKALLLYETRHDLGSATLLFTLSSLSSFIIHTIHPISVLLCFFPFKLSIIVILLLPTLL